VLCGLLRHLLRLIYDMLQQASAVIWAEWGLATLMLDGCWCQLPSLQAATIDEARGKITTYAERFTASMLNALATSEQGVCALLLAISGDIALSSPGSRWPIHTAAPLTLWASAGEKVRLAALEHVRLHKDGLTKLLEESAALQAEVGLTDMHVC
jgi:hypothetical protein